MSLYMEKKMTVYIVAKQTNHDYASAGMFGDTSILFPLGVHIIDARVIATAARAWFADFNFDEDYFLPIGNPIVVAIISLCLAEELEIQQKDSINFLEWDKYRQTYSVNTYEVEDDSDE